MNITFFGGAKSVTGSNYLVEAGGKKIMVDCGLFQGSKYSEDLNYEKFAYDPSQIDFVLVTHSHADHSGRLPKLFKEGFRGIFYTTTATLDMIKVALPDNLGLITEEAKKHDREPLFNQKDLDGMMSLAKGVNYDEPLVINDEVKITFHDAGHILGSSIIEINEKGKKIFFSGDLGNPPTPLLKPYEYPLDADYIVTESAYGNRIHEDRAQRKQKLEKAITDTINRGGVLMIPSFAMERTQELLYELNNMINANMIPKVPIFVDSPLAINLTKVYKEHPEYFNQKAVYLIKSGDDIFNFPGLKMTVTSEESKTINDIPAPKIIIAGSGMSNGGRILHHEIRYLPDSKSTLLIVGYQAQGSLGRAIFDGKKEVHIFGERVEVKCEVEAIGGYSAHADQTQLLNWIKKGAEGGNLKKVFVVQGEVESADVLAEKIKQETGIDAVVPDPDQKFEL